MNDLQELRNALIKAEAKLVAVEREYGASRELDDIMDLVDDAFERLHQLFPPTY